MTPRWRWSIGFAPFTSAFAVPEKHLPRLRAGLAGNQAGKAALKATVSLPGDKTTPLTGEVRFIDNAVDAATGTIQMKATLANEAETLTPGQFVNVALVLETLAQAVTVPAEAVQQGPEGPFLYVVRRRRRTVAQGAAGGHPGRAGGDRRRPRGRRNRGHRWPVAPDAGRQGQAGRLAKRPAKPAK